jgi:hypothetical protein
MSGFDRLWLKTSRSHNDVKNWLTERLLPIDENTVSFLSFGDQKRLEEFATFCHHHVTDRDEDFFTIQKRQKLYKQWLYSGERCLMAVEDTNGDIIGCTVILPLSGALFERFCSGNLDAIDVDSFEIESAAPCDHRYLLIDIMAFDYDRTMTMEGIPYRALLRHFAELYDPHSHGDLSIACGTAVLGLRERLQNLSFDCCGKESGAEDSYIYRACITNQKDLPVLIEELHGLIDSAITDYRSRLKSL